MAAVRVVMGLAAVVVEVERVEPVVLVVAEVHAVKPTAWLTNHAWRHSTEPRGTHSGGVGGGPAGPVTSAMRHGFAGLRLR